MYTQKNIKISFLSFVLTAAVFLSAFALLRVSPAVASETEWAYTYSVIRNTDKTVTYLAQPAIEQDFKVYRWSADATYSTAPTLQSGYPKAVDSTTARTYNDPTNSWRNAGYFDLQYANATSPTALTHKEQVNEFYLEMDLVVGKSWSVHKGIMIAPLGEHALVNDGNASSDKGIYIGITRGGNLSVSGAVDMSTAAAYSSVDVASTVGGALVSEPLKSATNKFRAGGMGTWVEDTANLPVLDGGCDLVTVGVNVRDGILSVFFVENGVRSEKMLSVRLTAQYTGGYVSYVSVGQNYSAFAGMRLTEYPPRTEWEYTVKQNTDNTVAYLAQPMIESDFQVYQWDTDATYSTAPVLKTGFPKAVDATTVRTNSDTAVTWRNAGYLDLQYASGTVAAALTHKQQVNEFYLEMDLVVGNSWSVHKGIMIAPLGEHALVNDGKADTDKGIYIGVTRNGNLSVAGAIDVASATALSSVELTSAAGGALVTEPLKSATNKVRAGGMGTWTEDKTNLAVAGGGCDIVTVAVEVREGMLFVYMPDSNGKAEKVIVAKLTDAYTGGHVSFVSVSQNYSAFAGMRLKSYAPMSDGSVALNTATGIITVKETAEKQLKAGSFLVTDNSGNAYVPTRLGFRVSKQSSLYKVQDANGNTVTDFDLGDVAATFMSTAYTDAENYTANLATYGISVNTEKKGLRFVSRISRFEENGTEYMRLGDENYPLQDYGVMYVIGEAVTVDKSTAVKYSHKDDHPYYDLCESYAEMAATVYDLGGAYKDSVTGETLYEDLADAHVFARAYAVIEVDGEPVYIYGEQVSASYNGTLYS